MAEQQMSEKLIDLIRNAPKLEFLPGSRCQGKTYQTAKNLADHLIANGVVVPPVTVGQTVWVIVGRMLPHIAECEVVAVAQQYMNLDDKRKVFLFSVVAKNSRTPEDFVPPDIGVRVFFTKEHAEKALAERSSR